MKRGTNGIALLFFALLLSTGAGAQATFRQESSSYAKAFSPLITEEEDGLKLAIQFDNPRGERVEISFLSESGDGMRFTVRDTAYAQRFNLATLEDGTYTLTLRKGKDSVTRKIRLNTTSYTIRTKEFY